MCNVKKDVTDIIYNMYSHKERFTDIRNMCNVMKHLQTLGNIYSHKARFTDIMKHTCNHKERFTDMQKHVHA